MSRESDPIRSTIVESTGMRNVVSFRVWCPARQRLAATPWREAMDAAVAQLGLRVGNEVEFVLRRVEVEDEG